LDDKLISDRRQEDSKEGLNMKYGKLDQGRWEQVVRERCQSKASIN
jgi:hypothetical protein